MNNDELFDLPVDVQILNLAGTARIFNINTLIQSCTSSQQETVNALKKLLQDGKLTTISMLNGLIYYCTPNTAKALNDAKEKKNGSRKDDK